MWWLELLPKILEVEDAVGRIGFSSESMSVVLSFCLRVT